MARAGILAHINPSRSLLRTLSCSRFIGSGVFCLLSSDLLRIIYVSGMYSVFGILYLASVSCIMHCFLLFPMYVCAYASVIIRVSFVPPQQMGVASFESLRVCSLSSSATTRGFFWFPGLDPCSFLRRWWIPLTGSRLVGLRILSHSHVLISRDSRLGFFLFYSSRHIPLPRQVPEFEPEPGPEPGARPKPRPGTVGAASNYGKLDCSYLHVFLPESTITSKRDKLDAVLPECRVASPSFAGPSGHTQLRCS